MASFSRTNLSLRSQVHLYHHELMLEAIKQGNTETGLLLAEELLCDYRLSSFLRARCLLVKSIVRRATDPQGSFDYATQAMACIEEARQESQQMGLTLPDRHVEDVRRGLERARSALREQEQAVQGSPSRASSPVEEDKMEVDQIAEVVASPAAQLLGDKAERSPVDEQDKMEIVDHRKEIPAEGPALPTPISSPLDTPEQRAPMIADAPEQSVAEPTSKPKGLPKSTGSLNLLANLASMSAAPPRLGRIAPVTPLRMFGPSNKPSHLGGTGGSTSIPVRLSSPAQTPEPLIPAKSRPAPDALESPRKRTARVFGNQPVLATPDRGSLIAPPTPASTRSFTDAGNPSTPRVRSYAEVVSTPPGPQPVRTRPLGEVGLQSIEEGKVYLNENKKKAILKKEKK